MMQYKRRVGLGSASPTLSLRTRLALALTAATLAVAIHVAGSRAAAPPASAVVSSPRLEARADLVEGELRRLRGDGAPVTEDAVGLLLVAYADQGQPEDLQRAERAAREQAGRAAGMASPGPLYRVALAGGNTFADAETRLGDSRRLMSASLERATTDTFGRLVQDFFARAAVLGTPEAFSEALVSADNFLQARVRRVGNRLQPIPGGSAADFTTFLDHLESLNAAMAAAEVVGAPDIVETVSLLSHELLVRYWDNDLGRCEFPARDVIGLPASVVPMLNARAAVALWRAGWITGEPIFQGRSQRLLDAIVDEARQAPESAIAAAAAAALLSREPVLVVIVGDPADPGLADLRRAANSFFQPHKVVVHLDPLGGGGRLAALGIDPAPSPCVFVRAGSFLSGPIRDASLLATETARLLERAAGTE
jgi:hypothetical protein